MIDSNNIEVMRENLKKTSSGGGGGVSIKKVIDKTQLVVGGVLVESGFDFSNYKMIIVDTWDNFHVGTMLYMPQSGYDAENRFGVTNYTNSRERSVNFEVVDGQLKVYNMSSLQYVAIYVIE